MGLLTRGDTDLLVAALGAPDAAVPAWIRWRAENTIDAAPWPQARLFTLVGHRLRTLDAADADLDRLRGTQRHAWAKAVATTQEAADACAELAERHVPSMLLKGVGLQLAYPAPGLRVMGDADLLVPEQFALKAATVLRRAGWETSRLANERWGHLLLADKGTVAVRNGWEIDLHWRPLHDLPGGRDAPLWDLSAERTVHGRRLRLPDASHQLVVVLAHGMRDGSGAALQGLCDAMMLIRTGECDPTQAALLARHWQRLAALRHGVALLRRLAPDDEIRAFADAVEAAGRPEWRDTLGQRARTMAPGRVSIALAGLATATTHDAPAGAEAETVRLEPATVAWLSNPDLAPQLVRGGWSGIEEWGRWTDGPRARLAFTIEGPTSPQRSPVSFWVHCHLGRRGRQRILVKVNGRRAAVWKWRDQPTARSETIHVPVGTPVEIEFRVRHLAPVGPIDRRLLGLALQWFRIEPSDSATR